MSVAPLTSAPVAPSSASETVLSEKSLDRVGKIVPLIAILVAAIILPLAAWYGMQTAQKAYLDTLISERGARNAETRTMVETLRKDFTDSEKANAEFRGRTDESLKSIKDALLIERADRQGIRGE